MSVSRRTLIRPLTDLEKRVAGKYFAQLSAAETEAARLRDLLNDLAISFAGREGAVEMTTEALYQPEAS